MKRHASFPPPPPPPLLSSFFLLLPPLPNFHQILRSRERTDHATGKRVVCITELGLFSRNDATRHTTTATNAHLATKKRRQWADEFIDDIKNCYTGIFLSIRIPPPVVTSTSVRDTFFLFSLSLCLRGEATMHVTQYRRHRRSQPSTCGPAASTSEVVSLVVIALYSIYRHSFLPSLPSLVEIVENGSSRYLCVNGGRRHGGWKKREPNP